MFLFSSRLGSVGGARTLVAGLRLDTVFSLLPILTFQWVSETSECSLGAASRTAPGLVVVQGDAWGPGGAQGHGDGAGLRRSLSDSLYYRS